MSVSKYSLIDCIVKPLSKDLGMGRRESPLQVNNCLLRSFRIVEDKIFNDHLTLRCLEKRSFQGSLKIFGRSYKDP